MAEETIECGEGRKCNSDCNRVPEGCFRFTKSTTLQVSGLAYIADQQEQPWHE